MGTNFYVLEEFGAEIVEATRERWVTSGETGIFSLIDFDSEYSLHVGKRSAAGLFCWDCYKSLCKEGPMGVHHHKSEWWDACPSCDKRYSIETLHSQGNSMGVKLGFARVNVDAPTGVRSCCSFSWAVEPTACLSWLKLTKGKVLEDEYGTLYTADEFTGMLAAQCPIKLDYSLGVCFS